MRTQHDSQRAPARPLMHLSPEIPDRAELSGAGQEAAVRFFVITRAAGRAWCAINHRLVEQKGAFFWITGPAGSGKTHFLNYIAALNDRAGQLDSEAGRAMTLTLAVTEGVVELERGIATQIARELGDERKAAKLWRGLEAVDALRVALDEAKRQGMRAVTLLIDFGRIEADTYRNSIKTLAAMTKSVKAPRLMIVAASRGAITVDGVQTYAFSFDPDEEPRVIVGRARFLGESEVQAPAVTENGRSRDDSDEVFPFDREAVRIILALNAGTEHRIATAAGLARAVALAWQERSATAPIRTADLWGFEAVREAVKGRLGESGAVAMRIAEAAVQGRDSSARLVGEKLLGLVVLQHACGAIDGMNIDAIDAALCASAQRKRDYPTGGLPRLIEAIAALSHGAVAYDPATRVVRFNPDAAKASAITAFNAAIPLLNRFDATLVPVQDAIELQNAMDPARRSMAFALEHASRNRDTLKRASAEFGAPLRPEQLRCFDDYIAITEAGPAALIAAASQTERQGNYTVCLNEYDTLVALAAALPRIRVMRDYLQRTELDHENEDATVRSSPYGHLATECCLLQHDVNGSTRAKSVATLNALEARFERFKWTYAPAYRIAHDEWRQEMERAMLTVGEIREHLGALVRLNGIAMLGAPEGAELGSQFTTLEPRQPPCTLEAQLAPELSPRCPRCNYALGALSPREALNDLLARIRRAVTVKLTALSQGAIARLIKEHDRDNHLEGFLRIVQAAQTDALIRVFDDKLARYLGSLLEDNHKVPDARPVFGRTKTPQLHVASACTRQSKLSPRS